jgi:hypothetical protein
MVFRNLASCGLALYVGGWQSFTIPAGIPLPAKIND